MTDTKVSISEDHCTVLAALNNVHRRSVGNAIASGDMTAWRFFVQLRNQLTQRLAYHNSQFDEEIRITPRSHP